MADDTLTRLRRAIAVLERPCDAESVAAALPALLAVAEAAATTANGCSINTDADGERFIRHGDPDALLRLRAALRALDDFGAIDSGRVDARRGGTI